MAKTECQQYTYEANIRANVIYIIVVLKFKTICKNVSFAKQFRQKN
jgi:hypothetical protein